MAGIGIQGLTFCLNLVLNLMLWKLIRRARIPDYRELVQERGDIRGQLGNWGDGKIGWWTQRRRERLQRWAFNDLTSCWIHQEIEFCWKPAPRIGLSIEASRKGNWKWRSPNWRGRVLHHQDFLGLPWAIRRRGLVGAAEDWWARHSGIHQELTIC